jgi:hypothetical protein
VRIVEFKKVFQYLYRRTEQTTKYMSRISTSDVKSSRNQILLIVFSSFFTDYFICFIGSSRLIRVLPLKGSVTFHCHDLGGRIGRAIA